MTPNINTLFTTFCWILLSTALASCSSQQTMRLYSGPALNSEQESTLILPIEFALLSVDEQDVGIAAQTFRNTSLIIKLPAGRHTLIMQYSDIWEIDDENHDKLSTGPLVFELNMAPQEIFLVKTPPLAHYEQALEFIKKPMVQLQSSQQTLVASHIAKEDPLVFQSSHANTKVTFPNLKQLKFWWTKASVYERNQFRKWQNSTITP
jgi:uncharacterized protein YccT (UPF0319 family)